MTGTIKQVLKGVLPASRYDHSCRVADVAVELASMYGVNQEKAFLAGLLHDCAKPFSPKVTGDFSLIFSSEEQLLYDLYPKVWHAFVAPVFLKTVFDIQDEAILEAVKWHSTGTENMGTLTAIVFISDAVEPGRKYGSRDIVYDLAKESLVKAIFAIAFFSINKLLSQHVSIHPETINCYNYYSQLLNFDEKHTITQSI